MAIGDQEDMLGRIKTTIPRRWFASTTPGEVANTPVLDGLLTGPSWMMAWLYNLLEYVAAQRRISTASSFNLDLIARDFFGILYQRAAGESDVAYSARIKANLFAPKATRAAVISALQVLTGIAPTVFEPRNPSDTGGYGHIGMTQGTGLGYGVAGGYGSLVLPFQAFVTAFRPHGGGIANVGGYYGLGSGLPAFGGYGVGSLEYVSKAMIPASVTDDVIYSTIAATAPAATILWTAITNQTGSSPHTPPQPIIGRLSKKADSQTLSAAIFQGATVGRLITGQAVQSLAAHAVAGSVTARLILAQAAHAISAAIAQPIAWSPTDLSAGLTLTNANLTAITSISGHRGVRASGSISANTYFEFFVSSGVLGERYGVANASWSEANANGLGGDANSIAVDINGLIYAGNAPVALMSAIGPGSTLEIAVNPIAKKIWFRVNGRLWSAPAGVITGSRTGGTTGPIITAPVSISEAVSQFVDLSGHCSVSDTIWPHGGNATMTVSAQSGHLNMALGGVAVAGSGTSSITVTDTDTNVQAALTTLGYTAPTASQSDTITIQVFDQFGQNNTLTIPVALSPNSDPATGIGGIDISSMGTAPLFPAISTSAAALNITANFGASAFTDLVPAGYQSLSGPSGGTNHPPSPPSNLITSNETNSAITLSWTASTP